MFRSHLVPRLVGACIVGRLCSLRFTRSLPEHALRRLLGAKGTRGLRTPGEISYMSGMRGYFGIGVEGISKAMNAGSLFRSANAFGASFTFTVAATYKASDGGRADTSDSPNEVPLYAFETLQDMMLPNGCSLVGVELDDRAVDLPSFCHPRRAAYVLGMERGSLSEELVACCDHIVRIPTRFSLNLAAAGTVVMYDRLISVQRFADRPVVPGGAPTPLPPHAFGDPVWKRKHARRTRAGQ